MSGFKINGVDIDSIFFNPNTTNQANYVGSVTKTSLSTDGYKTTGNFATTGKALSGKNDYTNAIRSTQKYYDITNLYTAPPKYQIYTTSGSIDLNSGEKQAFVILIGGGGGGGGANGDGNDGASGGGGGSGGIGLYSLQVGTKHSFTIGAGGKGGNFSTNGNTGGKGGDTNIYNYTVYGGAGGSGGDNNKGGAGGSGGGVTNTGLIDGSNGPSGCGGQNTGGGQSYSGSRSGNGNGHPDAGKGGSIASVAASAFPSTNVDTALFNSNSVLYVGELQKQYQKYINTYYNDSDSQYSTYGAGGEGGYGIGNSGGYGNSSLPNNATGHDGVTGVMILFTYYL
jgi:hypothetical protein